MHNLSTVFNFELIRTLKKKSFWITALSFPIVFALVFAIIFFSNKATQDAAEDFSKEKFSFIYTDKSGVVSERLTKALKATAVEDKAAGIESVKSGDIDAYFYYPADLNKNQVEIYAKDEGLFKNSRYSTVAEQVLQQSAATKVDSELTTVLQGNVTTTATTYKDGQEYNGFAQLIAPGLFLVLFYVLITMFSNQMLTSTTEEKENRVIEMVLTTIKARTLIIGKILSLVTLAFIQILVILIPVVLAYIFFRDNLSIPAIDLSNIPLDPVRIAIGAVSFVASFMFFTGLLVGIGAAMPTAKEANGCFGVVIVLLFAPLYAVSLFLSAPESPIVSFLTHFPLTAPIPLMLRNAVGNLAPHEAVVSILILSVCAVAALAIAIRLFRYGALEYSKRLSLSTIMARKKSTRA